MSSRFPRLIDCLAFVALLLVPCVLVFQPLTAGAIPDFMDPVMYFFPMRWHAAHLIQDGQLPWWSRSILTGVPLFANPQSALAYPPTALMLAWPSGLAYTAPLLLQLGLFAASTHALLRRGGTGFPAALMGGALCLAGSYGWTQLQSGNFMNVLPWWPLWLIALLGFTRSPRAPALTGGALAVAMMILAGAHQLALYGALGLGLLVLPFCLTGEDRGRTLRFVLATGVLGLLIASPGWLPQLAFLRETARAEVLDKEAVLVGTLASPLEAIRQLAGASPDAGASVSIGGFALLLAGAVPPAGGRQRIWLGAWMGVIATLLLSWRPVTGFALDFVPGFGAFHDPKRILGVTQWLLILAAGLGVDGWAMSAEGPLSRRFMRLLPVFTLGALLAFAQWGLPFSYSAAAIPLAIVFVLVFLSWPEARTGQADSGTTARSWITLPFILIAVGLLAWDTSRTVDLSWRSASDLVGAGPPALLEEAKLQPGERFFAVDWKRDSSYDFRRPDLRDSALPNLAMLWNLEDIGGYEPARTPRYDHWLASAAPWPSNRQPWSSHFGLPFPPHPDDTTIKRLMRANPATVLLPRWGVPIYLSHTGEGLMRGLAPDWRAPFRVHLLYAPRGPSEAPRQLRLIDILGTSGSIEFVPTEASGAMTPVIPIRGGSEREEGLEVDPTLRVQKLQVGPEIPGAPLAGLEVRVLPDDGPAWAFLWSAKMDRFYAPHSQGGLQLRADLETGGRWAEVCDPNGLNGGRGRIASYKIEANRLDLNVEWNGPGPGVVEIHDAWWPGWKAWVNGTRVEVRPSGANGEGLWRWIEVPTGTSSVMLRYEPPLLRASLSACAAGLLMLLVAGWAADRRDRRSVERR